MSRYLMIFFINLILCLALNNASAATVTFIGGGGNDLWSNGANWDSSTVPQPTDAVVISGANNLTIDTASTVAVLSIDLTYTGTVTQNATLTCSGDFDLQGGAWLAQSMLLTVGGDFTIGDSNDLFDAGTGTVRLTGTGSIYNSQLSNAFHVLEVAASGQSTTMHSDIYVRSLCRVVGGTLNLKNATDGFDLHLRGDGQLLDMQGSLSGLWANGGEICFEAEGSGVVEVPGINYGQCAIRLLTVAPINAVFNQQGPISNCHYLETASDVVGGTVTYNTNDHDVDLTVFLNIGDSATSLGGTTANFGSSDVTTGTFMWFTHADDVINLESGNFLNHGSWWIWNSNVQVNPGTSTVTMADGDQISVTWNSKPADFYNLIIDSDDGSDVVILNSDVNVLNDLTLVDGSVDNTGFSYTIDVNGDMEVQSGSYFLAGSSDIFVVGHLTVANVTGCFDVSTAHVHLTGSSNLINPVNPFNDLTVGAVNHTTTLNSDIVVTGLCTVDGGAFDLKDVPDDMPYTLYLRGSGNKIALNGSGQVRGHQGNGGYIIYEATSTLPIHIAGIDYGDCGLRLHADFAGVCTFEQQGAMSNVHKITTDVIESGASLVWNTNNHDVTVQVYIETGAGTSALGGTTWNCGSSTITTNVNFMRFTHGSDVINMQSAIFNCGGFFENWQHGSVVDAGTSTLNMTGNGHIGVSWSQVPLTLYHINHLGSTLSLHDSITAQSFSVNADTQDRSVTFGAGLTYTLNQLHWSGSDPYHVILRSDTNGAAWLLNAAGVQTVDHVDVRDSDASLSVNPINATLYNRDLGNNTNWVFTETFDTIEITTGGGLLASGQSYTSPAWIEGTAASYVQNLTASVNSGPAFNVHQLSANEWYIDNASINNVLGVVLSEQSSTAISLSGSDGVDTFTASVNVDWTPIDLTAYSINNVAIRRGDSVLLTGNGSGTSLEIDADGDGTFELSGVPGDTFPVTYSTAGTFTAALKIDGIVVGQSLTVDVVGLDYATQDIAVRVGRWREIHTTIAPDTGIHQVLIEGFNGAQTVQETNTGEAYNLNAAVTVGQRGSPSILVRLSDGPAFVQRSIDEYTLEAVFSQMVASPLDPTLTVEEMNQTAQTQMVMRPYVENVRFSFEMFSSQSTFAGGATYFETDTGDTLTSIGEAGFQQVFDSQSNETIGILEFTLERPDANEEEYCFRTLRSQAASNHIPIEYLNPVITGGGENSDPTNPPYDNHNGKWCAVVCIKKAVAGFAIGPQEHHFCIGDNNAIIDKNVIGEEPGLLGYVGTDCPIEDPMPFNPNWSWVSGPSLKVNTKFPGKAKYTFEIKSNEQCTIVEPNIVVDVVDVIDEFAVIPNFMILCIGDEQQAKAFECINGQLQAAANCNWVNNDPNIFGLNVNGATATITGASLGFGSVTVTCGNNQENIIVVVINCAIPPVFDQNPDPTNGVNLTIFDGLISPYGGDVLSDEEEYNGGAITVANLNDTNGNGVVDVEETDINAGAEGRAEIDLMKLVIDKPIVAPNEEFKLFWTDNVRLWETSNKQNGTDYNHQSTEVTINVNDLPMTLWIEATRPSTSVGDIKIGVSYGQVVDLVTATAIWSSRERLINTGDWFLDTPNTVGQKLRNSINNHLTSIFSVIHNTDTNDLKYGIIDTGVGGRVVSVLLEFQLYPREVHQLSSRMELDIGRTIERRVETTVSNPDIIGPFSVLKSEESNDNNSDPDVVLNGVPIQKDVSLENNRGLVYAFDAPGVPGAPIAPVVYKINAKEFVRIRIGTPFEYGDGVDVIQGSSATFGVDDSHWHGSINCDIQVDNNFPNGFKLITAPGKLNEIDSDHIDINSND